MADVTKWEYCELMVDYTHSSISIRNYTTNRVTGVDMTSGVEKIYQKIAELGNDGWEMFQLREQHGAVSYAAYYFKRPLP